MTSTPISSAQISSKHPVIQEDKNDPILKDPILEAQPSIKSIIAAAGNQAAQQKEYRSSLLDPEEKKWAQLLGDRQVLFIKVEERNWECYFRDNSDEIWKIKLEPNKHLKNWNPEELKIELINVIKWQIDWLKKDRSYDSHIQNSIGISHLYVHFSKRQLKEKIINNHQNLGEMFDARDVTYEKIREVLVSLKNNGYQQSLNTLFTKINFLKTNWRFYTFNLESQRSYHQDFSCALLPFVSLDTKETACAVLEYAVFMNLSEYAERALEAREIA